MPTRDYDPISDLIETIGGAHLWPVTKITTDTSGKITIEKGDVGDYVCCTKNPEPLFTTKKESATISVKNGEYIKTVNPFAIRSILSNRKKNAFSVVWEDGTTTVVHCQEGDEWDDEKALAMCYTKKALGNKGNFNDKFNDALDNKMKIIKKEEPKIMATADVTLKTINIKANSTPSPFKDVTLHAPTCEKISVECNIDAITKTEVNSRFDEIGQTVKEAGKAAAEATRKVDEMAKKIAELTNEKSYEVYLYGTFTNEKKCIYKGTLDAIRSYIKSYAAKQGHGYYFRTWNSDGGMYIDYGSYSTYLYIPNLTNSEYAEK